MRSLTRSVRPCSGPGRAAAGSTSVITAFQRSATDERDRLDLDPRAGNREAAHLDEGARGPRIAEDLRAHGVDRSSVVDVGQEDRHLDDVAEPCARRRQHRADVREDLPRLRDDVALDEPALAVDRHAAGHEQQAACTHGVGVVADRLNQPGDADLDALAHDAASRIAVSVVRGLIASGSMRRASTAGRPASSARSSAPPNSPVRSTVSPCAPNARAYAAKSGLTRSVPTTRPGKCRSWCIRIVPYIPLSTTRMTIGNSYCTAVASSCPDMRKSPSPETHTTVRSGATAFAATAAGTP